MVDHSGCNIHLLVDPCSKRHSVREKPERGCTPIGVLGRSEVKVTRQNERGPARRHLVALLALPMVNERAPAAAKRSPIVTNAVTSTTRSSQTIGDSSCRPTISRPCSGSALDMQLADSEDQRVFRLPQAWALYLKRVGPANKHSRYVEYLDRPFLCFPL